MAIPTPEYIGNIVDITDNFCFVRVDSLGHDIFIHYSDLNHEYYWDNLTRHSSITFNLAFSII